MNSRVALITFLDDSGNRPDNSLPGVPPGVNVPGFPTHPIAPGGPPVGIWPNPPGGGGVPTHPIYNPPGVWPNPPGGGNYPTTGPVFPPVGPDNTLPPSGPPPTVSLPIVLPEPPEQVPPDIHFELKYSFRFGWVLVPISAEPK
jgi:hypothetical protein